MRRRDLLTKLVGLGSVALGGPGWAAPRDSGPAADRTRLVVLTDIGNEPDDSQSLVRLLCYADCFEIEALIAVTSTWLKEAVHPELIEERVRAYGKALPNLRVHAPGWPSEEQLLARIYAGRPQYGLAGVGPGRDTEASRRIIAIIDRPDPRPAWFVLWGGAVDLAQALDAVRRTRTPAEVEAFVSRIRVYAISDQDDAGPWIRATFPNLFWIGSVHAFGQYASAAWTGISADLLRPMPGADVSLVDHAWQDRHVVGRGPLGALYPRSQYIMEGDTPSFLHLIPNGLSVPERPDYGGWGGRYGKVSPHLGLHADAVDRVLGRDGEFHTSAQATIWRWREAFQNDFAARIAWTTTPNFREGSHPPQLILNGSAGPAPWRARARPGVRVILDATGSLNPDSGPLRLRWWQYREAGGGNAPQIELSASEKPRATFLIPKVDRPVELHVILEGSAAGSSPLVRYRRAIVEVSP